MEQYIKKFDLVAEIKRRKELVSDPILLDNDLMIGEKNAYSNLLSFIDNLEVKEVESDRKFECPNIKIKDAIEVSSRMKYIDEDLKPIAEFIMDYCSWNLHKDEWSQPTIEVPLFRVLDALAQRGKPYRFR